MRIVTSALLISVMTVTSCGAVRDSRVNPFNWFGRSSSQPVQQAPEATNPLIPRSRGLFANRRAEKGIYLGQPIDQVTDLVVERAPGGALIRATGISAVQGAYEVRLTPENEDEKPIDGVLTYRLEALTPDGARPGGSTATRTVVVARKLSAQQLRNVRTVRVTAARNVRTTRRR